MRAVVRRKDHERLAPDRFERVDDRADGPVHLPERRAVAPVAARPGPPRVVEERHVALRQREVEEERHSTTFFDEVHGVRDHGVREVRVVDGLLRERGAAVEEALRGVGRRDVRAALVAGPVVAERDRQAREAEAARRREVRAVRPIARVDAEVPLADEPRAPAHQRLAQEHLLGRHARRVVRHEHAVARARRRDHADPRREAARERRGARRRADGLGRVPLAEAQPAGR